MKKLIKSYKFWVAFAGSVGIFLMALSDTLGIVINVQGVKETIMAFCGILVVFGIVKKTDAKEQEPIAAENDKENAENQELKNNE